MSSLASPVDDDVRCLAGAVILPTGLFRVFARHGSTLIDSIRRSS
jgi:hypothetical protein